MNLPGFTAEASLYNCFKHYQGSTFISHNQHVIPQVMDICERKARQAYRRCVLIGYEYDDCLTFAVDFWDWCDTVYG